MGSAKWFLIVDDDPDTREIIINDIKEELSHEVKIVEARDGVEASLKLNIQAFDCIVTDLQMPKRDGAHFIEWVKKSPLNESTPIVVVTGFRDPELENDYDMLRVLEKPYKKEELINILETQIKLGRLDERLGASVLNTLIDISMLFVKKVLLTEASQSPAEAKSGKQELKGDVICAMKIKTSDGSCRLALGFDDSVLQEMRIAVRAPDELLQSQLVESALSVIFTLTQKMFAHNFGSVPTLEQKTVFQDKNNFNFKEISKTKGIVIPMDTGKGFIYAQALYSKPKAIKKAS